MMRKACDRRWIDLSQWCLAPFFLAAMWLAIGCVTEPNPLDKTQPESVNKAMFDGEWYYQVTVTDTEWHNPITFIGEQTQTFGGVAYKVRWEINQDLLSGYLIPQSYLDADGKPVKNAIGRESLVLSFPIERHFDIKYLQNNTTREELNVIVENTDRPWNERDYMIVDWSKNLVTDFWQPLGAEAVSGEIIREPIATWKNVEFFDTSDAKIDTRAWNPDKDLDVYVMNFDIEEQIYAPLSFSWEKYSDSHAEPALVKYRISLMKKDPRGAAPSTYEPAAYPDEFFRRFGYFRTEYATYDAMRGPLESQKQYFINRFDLSCSDGGACKTIDFYKSPSMPSKQADPELHGWLEDVVDAWSEAMQVATGRTDQVVRLLDNEPVLDEDGNQVFALDGTPRYKYEPGDIRYNFLNWVMKPGNGAPLGYGPSTPDADTGEIISATVNVYGNWVDYVITRAMDLYDVMAGNCTMQDIANGRYFDEEKKACSGGAGDNPTVGPGQMQSLDMDAEDRVADMDFLTPALRTAYWPKARLDLPVNELSPQSLAAQLPRAKELFRHSMKQTSPLDTGKLGILAGTRFEQMMVPHGTLGSTFPGATSEEDVVQEFSPASRLSAQNLQKMKAYFTSLALSTRTEPNEYENNVLGFVEKMKGKSRDEVKRELRHWIVYHVTLHEMGHTLGLRHNFKASTDERNFAPEYHEAKAVYWDKVEKLRTQYQAKINAGDAKAYEDYTKAVHAIPADFERYSSSSIMDYSGDFEGWVEMPSYDVAAIAFGYGRKVEVQDGDQWKWEAFDAGDFDKADFLAFDEASASGRVVRTYLFCSDERVWDDAFCSTFDRGVTATEIVRNFISDSYKDYFFSNFKRDRESFGQSSNYFRKWIRYYTFAKPLAQLQLNSMWYPEFWSSIWSGLNAVNRGPESRNMTPGYMPTGGEDLFRASMLYYYFLLSDVLQRPEYGVHKKSFDPMGNPYWEKIDPQSVSDTDIVGSIDMGAGWGWTDKWDNQYDTTIYYDKLVRKGVELDKIIAYEILSIPAALNEYLSHEKANGLSYWNSLWNGSGMQLWQVTRAFINDGFEHNQNPYCMNDEGKLSVQPFDMLEPLKRTGVLILQGYEAPARSCPAGYYPVQPGMDDLYAIFPMFFGLSGAQHPWYHNQLSDYMDSQVKGGNHRFDIPADATVAQFENSTGTKIYQAVQTDDGLSISYDIVDKAQRVSNRIRFVQACLEAEVPTSGGNPPEPSTLIGTYNRTCEEILAQCYGDRAQAPFCVAEGWDSLFATDITAYSWRSVDRAEAMLIMMQDMIDLAGHYAWHTPGYMDND
jgi:hypothetical protein